MVPGKRADILGALNYYYLYSSSVQCVLLEIQPSCSNFPISLSLFFFPVAFLSIQELQGIVTVQCANFFLASDVHFVRSFVCLIILNPICHATHGRKESSSRGRINHVVLLSWKQFPKTYAFSLFFYFFFFFPQGWLAMFKCVHFCLKRSGRSRQTWLNMSPFVLCQ